MTMSTEQSINTAESAEHPVEDAHLPEPREATGLVATRQIRESFWRRWGARLLPYALVICLMILFSALSPAFLTPDNLLNILRASSVLMVLALSSTIVILSGSIDLSVGAVAALTGTLAVIMTAAGNPGLIWLALPIGLVCGLVNGVLVAYAKLPSFLTTLGTLFIFDGLALRLTGGAAVFMDHPLLDGLVNGADVLGIPNVIWWAVLALIVMSVIAYRTPFGRHIYAIGGNERVARLSGLPVSRTKLWMFGLSGLVAGIGGLMLIGQGGGSSPGMGGPFLLNAIAAVVMGGTALSGGSGGPLRTVIGVLTLGIVTNGMTLTQVDPNYQTVIFGVIVLFAVLVTVRRSETGVVK
ncbi:ABC transporter permease [Microbacterium suwonense]|uniref:Autoinducer 2 import system permease protein LsrD n=1 Tax=Microbacterium suwonense TaxID=683047 RepID=A0ABN6X5P0_9MICO|nr:ABC transporter permease [Microbacterium suwonense]BDZ39317.1 sugar ABC transporter permease [Microbacterium suwonense]